MVEAGPVFPEQAFVNRKPKTGGGKGVENGIPVGDATVLASEHKVGTRAPKKPADIAALFQKLTPEERAEFLAKYAS